MVIPRGAPETWGLTHNDYSESIYNKIYLDVRPSESTIYTGPTLTAISGSPMKDRDSPTMTARNQPIMGYTLMAARVSQQPIRVLP